MAEKKKDTRKKSGRAMPPPEDPKDVNVAPGSPAAENLRLQQSEDVPSQQDLIEDAGAEVAPADITAEVKDDMVLMSFVKTTLLKERNTDNRFICLHLAALIGDVAATKFSPSILSRYRIMADDDGIPELGVSDAPLQFLEIFRAEDMKEQLREAVGLARVRLEVKETKGSGEAVKGIRLSFVAPLKLNDKTLHWAARQFGTLVFVRIGDHQAKAQLA